MNNLEILDSNSENLRKEMVNKFEELSGRKISNHSPEGLIFATVAYLLGTREEYYNDLMKQNYLKYARNNRLDLLGELYGDRGKRLKEQPARATFRFSIVSPKQKVITVPKNSLINYGNLYFKTEKEYQIKIGSTYVDGTAVCTTDGTVGNNIEIGEIKNMVDLYPYYSEVSNLTITNGGTDIENDEDYRKRLRMIPNSFTVAGAKEAYKFWTLSTSPEIIDVVVNSPAPCEVDIYLLTTKGEASEELKNKVLAVVNDDTIRPLTDKVKVKSAECIRYNINLEYYITKDNEQNINLIKNTVKKAINNYIEWQDRALGRDIVPDELIKELKLAGVKRILLNSPSFKEINFKQFTKVNEINLNYGGAEEI